MALWPGCNGGLFVCLVVGGSEDPKMGKGGRFREAEEERSHWGADEGSWESSDGGHKSPGAIGILIQLYS